MTGDTARWLTDGNIELVGRSDLSMFKINGLRINARQIEDVILTKCSKVQRALVFSAITQNKESILCAAVTVVQVDAHNFDSDWNAKCKEMKKSILEELSTHLPSYMIPSVITIYTNLPLTTNGKVDVTNLRQMSLVNYYNHSEDVMPKDTESVTETEELLRSILSDTLEWPKSKIQLNTNFRDQGINSLFLMKFANALSRNGVKGFTGIIDLFNHCNIKQLGKYIDRSSFLPPSTDTDISYPGTNQKTIENKEAVQNDDIAVVGMAFRLPHNIRTMNQLWNALNGGKSLRIDFPPNRTEDVLSRVTVETAHQLKACPAFPGCFLSSIDTFDHEYFGISPAEAKHMAPEHRLWMEVGTEALQDAGVLENVKGESMGVFVAASEIEYDRVDHDNEGLSVVGRMPSMLPTRMAYQYDLKGQAVLVDTACSSGLVAISNAVDAIRSGRCESALVGGVSLILYPSCEGAFGSSMSTQSPDFTCRAFDESANGTMAGEGVIAFVLEPLSRAIKLGHHVYGLIQSHSLNSVGRGNGITAPSLISQSNLIQTALKNCNLDPRDVTFIETHGTGTPLGDSIELSALESVFKARGQDRSTPLYVCTTKPIFGHLDSTAGLLGILKTLLIFHYNQIPPNVNLNSGMKLLTESKVLVSPKEPVTLPCQEKLWGGVSAFGLSGTNVHIILSNNYGLSQNTAERPSRNPINFKPTRHWPDPIQFPTTPSIIQYTPNIQSDPVEKLDELLYERMSQVQELIQSLSLAPEQNYLESMDEFCTALITRYLGQTRLRAEWRKGNILEHARAFEVTGIHPRYEKLFRVMIRHLEIGGVLTGQSYGPGGSLNSFVFLKDISDNSWQGDPNSIVTRCTQLFPAYADCFNFPLYCSEHYPDVLNGDKSPLTVIYPKGDLNFMYKFKRLGDQLGDVYYNMYIQLVAEHVKSLASKCVGEGQKIRILEVGAGMGFVTKQLVPKLMGEWGRDTIEYWFTDLGKAFVENGRSVFKNYSSIMAYSVFDITVPPTQQGIHCQFDIILSYNVIHTTPSILKSVQNLKSALTDDGVLFVIESAKNETWATLAWGLLDGWWLFEDSHLRPTDPMLEPSKWQEVLKTAGFGTVLTCPTDTQEQSHVEKTMFICTQRKLKLSKRVTKNQQRVTPNLEEEQAKGDGEEQQQQLKNLTPNNVLVTLKKIWKQRLGLDEIQEEDVFKELGGESLLAIQMMQDVRSQMGVQLEIAHVFAYPSLGGLAKFIFAMSQTTATEVNLKGHDDMEALNVEIESKLLTAAAERLPASVAHPQLIIGLYRKTMILFGGQGSQRLNMCEGMMEYPSSRSIIQTTNDILGIDFIQKCKDPAAMSQTQFVQIALFVSSVAKWAQFKSINSKSSMEKVVVVGGLSVGEFAVLVIAGVLKFEDGLQLVKIRGEAMQSQLNKMDTGMVSVLGPSTVELKKSLAKYPQLHISSYLGDNQHMTSGPSQICEAYVQEMKNPLIAKSNNIIDIRRLKVGGGFHSEYMKEVAMEFDPFLDQIQFSEPNIPIVMNFSGEIQTEPKIIREELKAQLASPIQWKRSMETAVQMGVTHFIEIAPASVLSSIVRQRITACQKVNSTTQFIKI